MSGQHLLKRLTFPAVFHSWCTIRLSFEVGVKGEYRLTPWRTPRMAPRALPTRHRWRLVRRHHHPDRDHHF